MHEMQDLADQIDALREATAGYPLRIRVTMEIGENGNVDQSVVEQVNTILGQIKTGWRAE